MRAGDFEWRDIGSGVFAKTFRQMDKLVTTGKGGPPEIDVARRIIRNLTTGKVIDDCVPEDTSDAILHRQLPSPQDLRVELVMKGALKMYDKSSPDICEM